MKFDTVNLTFASTKQNGALKDRFVSLMLEGI